MMHFFSDYFLDKAASNSFFMQHLVY